MIKYIEKRRFSLKFKLLSIFISISLTSSFIVLPSNASAQSMLNLPEPGMMISTSTAFTPAIMTGMTIYPENPLQFDFIIDIGDDKLQGEALKNESQKLINYFMATLTVPEEEMWVNLSPYEKDRIIAEGLGNTEMGRDMLAQDYMLKQLTASLMYPENEFGSDFWERVYSKTQEKFGTTNLPTNTFNKIWIIPEEAVVYVNKTNVFVVESHLKVMLEEDYLALETNQNSTKHGLGDIEKDDIEIISGVSADIVREVLLPEIEKEVNEGKNFANLRQIYNSMLLATWYKKNLKESLLGKVYVDQNKVNGIDVEDKEIKQKIYNQYVEAFKKGVYDYIKEDYNPNTQEIMPRKYFSGGLEDWEEGSWREGQPSNEWVGRKAKRTHYVARTNADVIGDFAMFAMDYKTVMTRDDIDQHIDEVPKMSRPGIGFYDPTGNGELVIVLEQFGGMTIPVTKLSAFTAYDGVLYIAHLEQADEMEPAFAIIKGTGISSAQESIAEVGIDALPEQVQREFGIIEAQPQKASEETALYAYVTDYTIEGENGRGDIPDAKQLKPTIPNRGRQYQFVRDSESGEMRVARPGDLYKEFAHQAKSGRAPVAVFPSAWVSASIKNGRDARKIGERKKNVPEFQAILKGTKEHLQQKAKRTSQENEIIEFLSVLERVMEHTGLTAEQLSREAELTEAEHIDAQKKAQQEVRTYLQENILILGKFIPMLRKNAGLVDYLSQAQGFYGEQAVLSAYFRAFRLLSFAVFTGEKEDVFRGLQLFRAINNASATLNGKMVAVKDLLSNEENYLSDTGRKNYDTSFSNLLTQGDPIISEALTTPDDNLRAYVDARFLELRERLEGKPHVGQSRADVDEIGESAMPDGFTPLTLSASLDGEVMQHRGDDAIKDAQTIDEMHTKVGARYEWIIELFLKFAGASFSDEKINQMIADLDENNLTAVDKLYQSLGVMLDIARKKFSKEAYALFEMMVISDFVLKAEETIKARQPAMFIRTKGISMAPPEEIPTVYVSALPSVYEEMAKAVRSQYIHLEASFREIADYGAEDHETATKLRAKLEKLEEIADMYAGLAEETREYLGNEIEQPVPIKNESLNRRVFKEWVETGNIGNAKPVSAPLHFISNDEPKYDAWVNFIVGGAWGGTVQTNDGRTANFSTYHVMRAFSQGTESITTADLTGIINDQGNVDGFNTPDGVTSLLSAHNVDYVDFYTPVDNAMTSDDVDKAKLTHGGIDFNPGNMNFNERGDIFNFNFSANDLENININAVEGVLPVIINITPVNSIIPMLGLEPSKKEEDLELSRVN